MTVAETAPPPPLTLLEADRLAREIIDEVGPDYRYTIHPGIGVCQYVYEGEPDCIVGRILHRHGVSIATLRKWEGSTAAEMCRVYQGTQPLLTMEASQFLDDLQGEQDGGATWGSAYSFAVRKHLGSTWESTVVSQGGEHRDH